MEKYYLKKLHGMRTADLMQLANLMQLAKEHVTEIRAPVTFNERAKIVQDLFKLVGEEDTSKVFWGALEDRIDELSEGQGRTYMLETFSREVLLGKLEQMEKYHKFYRSSIEPYYELEMVRELLFLDEQFPEEQVLPDVCLSELFGKVIDLVKKDLDWEFGMEELGKDETAINAPMFKFHLRRKRHIGGIVK